MVKLRLNLLATGFWILPRQSLDLSVKINLRNVAASMPSTATAITTTTPQPPLALKERLDHVFFTHCPHLSPKLGVYDLSNEHAEIALNLLADVPPSDLDALDLIAEIWPKTTIKSRSRVLLAIALHLSSKFGIRGERRSMCATKAWRMLDRDYFETATAAQLQHITDFIFTAQRNRSMLLLLEYVEMELIENLFESLNPALYCDELAAVMNFKALSLRRLGLIRRIPLRMKRMVEALMPAEEALVLQKLSEALVLLDTIMVPDGFAPILKAAEKAHAEIEKMIIAIEAPASAPNSGKSTGPANGAEKAPTRHSLGRIG